MTIDLRRLRYFVAVVEEGNVHRAAERLHIVQSALSRRIVELESELGVILLDRLPRGVRATAAGQALMVHARRILAQVEQATEHMRQIALGGPGRVRLGITPLSGTLPGVARAICRFREQFPDADLHLVPLNSESQLAALHAGEIEVGLRYHRPVDPEISCRVLQEHCFVLALSREHPLAKRDVLRVADISNEGFVGFPRDHDPVGYDTLLSACLRANLMPRFVQEAHSEETRLGLVSVGLGVAIVNATVLDRRSIGDVVFLPIDDLPVTFELCVTWSESLSPQAAALVRCFEEVLQGAPKAPAMPVPLA